MIRSDDERSENDVYVEIESDGESDAHESSSSCPDEKTSRKGNTRKKKTSSTKQGPKASSSKDTVTRQTKVSNKSL